MTEPPYPQIWTNALPYLGVRSNAEHTRYCIRFAQTLLPATSARPVVVLPAIILHDIGWSTVPEEKILESFGPGAKYPGLRRQHEVEGARLARAILGRLGCDPPLIEEVARIIDGHDTREEPESIEDAVVKDADKLWCYTRFGVDTVRGWFGHSLADQLSLLSRWTTTRFHTEPGRLLAAGLLAALEVELTPVAPV